MAAAEETAFGRTHVEEKKKIPRRYWATTAEQKDGEGKNGALQKEDSTKKIREAWWKKKLEKKKKKKAKKSVLEKKDPFPGQAPIPVERVKKFVRGDVDKVTSGVQGKLKKILKRSQAVSTLAQEQAARHDLLLPEDAGFLEGDEDEDTCTIAQDDIADAVDITSGAKYFNLNLSQFGPYRLDYSRAGRHLLLGGRRGHVSCIEWQSKALISEINVMEAVNDVKWLHNEAMFAVAQKKWLYVYDSKGVELHCIRKFNDVLRMEFLPYHFLLATASSSGFLQYLDVSVGKEVTAIGTKMGRLGVMTQNPHNAVIHLGHPNGTVSLWSPNQKEALVKMLCHRGAVRSLTVDKTGMYMVTSGLDRKLKVYDLRAFKPLQSYFLPAGAACLSLSQRGLLCASMGDVVQVYRDVWGTSVKKPYMAHRVRGAVAGLAFCPFEDVLGVGHAEGFTSMIVPGAGEANFDGMALNPYASLRQRQEWEVKTLLEKVQPDLIGLDPSMLGTVDRATWQQKHQERVQALGFDPLAHEKFKPRRRKKGRSSSGAVEKRKRKVAHEDQRDVIRHTVAANLSKEQERKKRSKAKLKAGVERCALKRFQK
uniref:WD repeat-containing protein 46 n=2 Tax=Denticeps clupeoides TaxID=299321 RepID=A0AAY4CPE8_9TELE